MSGQLRTVGLQYNYIKCLIVLEQSKGGYGECLRDK
jgi:hypothetical protein